MMSPEDETRAWKLLSRLARREAAMLLFRYKNHTKNESFKLVQALKKLFVDAGYLSAASAVFSAPADGELKSDVLIRIRNRIDFKQNEALYARYLALIENPLQR